MRKTGLADRFHPTRLTVGRSLRNSNTLRAAGRSIQIFIILRREVSWRRFGCRFDVMTEALDICAGVDRQTLVVDVAGNSRGAAKLDDARGR